MSVVSELRALAVELEAEAERYALNPNAATMLRHAAQRARLRALRAEQSVECRTDERPRFAVLAAPQRPSATPQAIGLVCAWCRCTPCKNGDGCKAAGLCSRCTEELPCLFHC